MATVLRFIDEATGGTRLDLNDRSGWRLSRGFDTGLLDLGETWIKQESVPGSSLAVAHRDIRQMSIPLHLSLQSSWVACRDLIEALAEELDRERNVLEFIPDASDRSYYIDTFRSPVPSLFRAQDYESVAQRLQDHAVPILIKRLPYSRGDLIPGVPTALTNQVGNRELIVNNPGNVPALTVVRITPEAGAKFGQARIMTRSKGNLSAFATLYDRECESGTLGVDTTSVAGVAGASGNVAQVSFATVAGRARRIKLVDTPTDPTSVAGTLSNRIRVKPSGAGGSKFRIQLRWGMVDSDPVSFSNDWVVLDFDDIDSVDWIRPDLGECSLGSEGGTLIREIWVERVSGADSLYLDILSLYPADEQHSILAVPGLRQGKWGVERWRGDDLTGTGTIRERTARVDAIDETMGTPLQALAPGVHEFKVVATVHNLNNAASLAIGRFEVVDDLGVIRKSVKLRSRPYRLQVRREKKFQMTITAADAGRTFTARVRQIEAADEQRRIRIHRIRHTFLRTVTELDELVVDGPDGSIYVRRTGGAVLFPVPPEGTPFPEAAPGDSLWLFEWGDIPTDPGYDDVDYREPQARSVRDRSATVTVDVIPRYTH